MTTTQKPGMNRDEAILRYKTAMAVFKTWLANGAISDDDLQAINAVIAQKYGLSSSSIFLENDLIYKANRGIYVTAKGGLS